MAPCGDKTAIAALQEEYDADLLVIGSASSTMLADTWALSYHKDGRFESYRSSTRADSHKSSSPWSGVDCASIASDKATTTAGEEMADFLLKTFPERHSSRHALILLR